MYMYLHSCDQSTPNILVWESLSQWSRDTQSKTKPFPSLGWTLAAFIHLNPRITKSSRGFVTLWEPKWLQGHCMGESVHANHCKSQPVLFS